MAREGQAARGGGRATAEREQAFAEAQRPLEAEGGLALDLLVELVEAAHGGLLGGGGARGEGQGQRGAAGEQRGGGRAEERQQAGEQAVAGVADAAALLVLRELQQLVAGRLDDGELQGPPQVRLERAQVQRLQARAARPVHQLPQQRAVLQVRQQVHARLFFAPAGRVQVEGRRRGAAGALQLQARQQRGQRGQRALAAAQREQQALVVARGLAGLESCVVGEREGEGGRAALLERQVQRGEPVLVAQVDALEAHALAQQPQQRPRLARPLRALRLRRAPHQARRQRPPLLLDQAAVQRVRPSPSPCSCPSSLRAGLAAAAGEARQREVQQRVAAGVEHARREPRLADEEAGGREGLRRHRVEEHALPLEEGLRVVVLRLGVGLG